MKRTILLLAVLLALFGPAHAARPRLVVQIVVGSMRAEDLDRYAAHFGEGGFKRLMRDGVRYTDARYDCQQTTTPASLATLATGALPATHGIIAARWQDYTLNRSVDLVSGRRGNGAYNLVAPTLAETLLDAEPGAQSVSIAAEATSAIVQGGGRGRVYWLERQHAGWESSLYYAQELPGWITQANRERHNQSFILQKWETLLAPDNYRNSRFWDIALPGSKAKPTGLRRMRAVTSLEHMLYTPAGNSVVLDFAREAIGRFALGGDETPDLLCLCLDASRHIAETYGPESIEVEDMYYRLDRDLERFLTALYEAVPDAAVVLTSDHGTSPSYDAGKQPASRFNARQFEVIVNGFLNVRYGKGDWILEYEDHCIYLNHNLVYEKGLNLSEVQNEVAVFAMQFGGVSHALSATAMRSSYFAGGYARQMQNGFYPRRSGDVIVNLMPGWIEEDELRVSMSGSMYRYDTHVPLVVAVPGAAPRTVARRVAMTSLAPTVARILEVVEPAASEGDVLDEFE